eukprot:184115_1
MNTKSKHVTDFKLSWIHIIECIKNEMWPELAFSVETAIKMNNEKPEQQTMNDVINILKNEQDLPSEECEYLKQLMIRAKGFDPNEYNQRQNHHNSVHRDDDKELVEHQMKGVTKSLLMDIYDVHNSFTFMNSNFEEYSIKQFVAEAGCEPSFCACFSLFPGYIVDDDLFRVFEYVFSVSLFANTLKRNLYISGDTRFEMQCIIIPHSVSCIYDEHMILPNDIGTMERYLIDEGITDYCKIKFKSQIEKDPTDVANRIEQLYNADDIMDHEASKLVIIVDRRRRYDVLYAFPSTSHRPELETNYFVRMHFELYSNKVMAYFGVGDRMTRFFPQMLVSVVPRFFRKPHRLSQAQYVHRIYENSFKNGWCVTLEDDTFDKYYKMITKCTHVSVNYNRHVLYDEFYQKKPMLCFMDLLYHELESNRNIDADDMKQMDSFFDANDYCSDAIIDDVSSHTSNIETLMRLNRKYYQYEAIRDIVQKYNAPSHDVVNQLCAVDKCPFIRTIIDGLTQQIDLNAADVLCAYDHIVSVHSLLISPKVQRYIVDAVGGYCTAEACSILQKHMMRRVEGQKDGNAHGLKELLDATLSALHCQVLHEKKELLRLKRKHGKSHFVPIFGDKECQCHDYTAENGVSVLQWFDYGQHARFSGFHEEMIRNPYSTIDRKTYLDFAQECCIKMSHIRHEEYLLDEVIALKLYTDTNVYQLALRKAYCISSAIQMKQSFYNWALLLHKTALFHSKPIHDELYHAMDRPLELDDTRPKYNGPTSVSLEKCVPHSFAKAQGLFVSIKPSYANKFNFVTGICMEWISHHKNEREVMLIDQYVAIAATRHINTVTHQCQSCHSKAHVDHLLHTIKSYQKAISNKDAFYKLLGAAFASSWIPFISAHQSLYDRIDKDPTRRVLDVLLQDLEIDAPCLRHRQRILSAPLAIDVYITFCSFCPLFNIKQEDITLFKATQYKIIDNLQNEIVFKFGDRIVIKDGNLESKSYSIFVKNKTLFNMNRYIPLHDIDPSVFSHDETWNFAQSLEIKQDKVIVVNHFKLPFAYAKHVLASTFVLLCDDFADAQQISADKMNRNHPVYTFNSMMDIRFIVPFRRALKRVRLYVQFKPKYKFVFVKQFDIMNPIAQIKRKNRVDYVLQVLKLFDGRITDPRDFYNKIGITLNETDLPIIQRNAVIEEPGKAILSRLVDELDFTILQSHDVVYQKHIKKKKKRTQSFMNQNGNENRRRFSDFYSNGRMLGAGSFATVKRCTRKSDKHEHAVKIIDKRQLKGRELVQLRDEIRILKSLDHPHLISLVDVFDDGRRVKMVLELCAGGDLFKHLLKAPNKRFDEPKCARIMSIIARALEYIHNHHIVHRDLKPDNILFTKDDVLKISDFGLAHYKQVPLSEHVMHTCCGTPHYVAPEMLLTNEYDYKIDFWALGIILYIMLSGRQPFSSDSITGMYGKIRRGEYSFRSRYWGHISEDAKDLVRKLMCVDDKKRYSTQQIMEHQWILKHVDLTIPKSQPQMKPKAKSQSDIIVPKNVQLLVSSSLLDFRIVVMCVLGVGISMYILLSQFQFI